VFQQHCEAVLRRVGSAPNTPTTDTRKWQRRRGEDEKNPRNGACNGGSGTWKAMGGRKKAKKKDQRKTLNQPELRSRLNQKEEVPGEKGVVGRKFGEGRG